MYRVDDSYFLQRIIILHLMSMTRNLNRSMGNVMIVRFVCNQLSFLHYLFQAEVEIQLR